MVTTLKDAGFSNHEVCAVTGHQNQASIENYDRLDRKGSKRPSEMAAMLDGKENVPTCVPAAKRLQLQCLQDSDALSKINEGLFSLSASNCTFNNLTINVSTGVQEKQQVQQQTLWQGAHE